MERLFRTHNIRKTYEADSLWDFSAGDYRGKITVPSCWETIPALASYKGKAVYTKKMIFGGNIRLAFKGVSHTADVYCDGEHIAHHYNAYTPFHVDISTEYGEHEIKIVVDNSYSEDSALHVENDYYTYGGIIRPLIIEELNNVFIERIRFTPLMKEGGWSAKVEVDVTNKSETEESIEIRLGIGNDLCISENISVSARQTTTYKFNRVFSDVSAYSMDNPVLYELNAVLYKDGIAFDDLIDRVGFREIGIDGKKLLMNGKPLKLRGFNRHEDFNIFGSSIPLQAIMRDIALMKEAGANCVRTSHYPNDERFLDICDEMGLLVWEEAHARGLEEERMKNPNFESQSLQCIDEMINMHYNHPSIFCWGILNECASHTEFGRSCYKKQYDKIASLDTSRPKTSASFRMGNDICLDLEDIVSFNIYPSWYHDKSSKQTIEELKTWIAETGNGNKPLIISEIGAGGIYGFRSDIHAKWSEERQAQILEEQLDAVLNDEDVCGVFIWQFSDVRVDESWFAQRPKTQNNKGIVDEFRRKKLAYNTVKRIFTAK